MINRKSLLNLATAEYSALDIAKYFIWKSNTESRKISNKKLQKLLYYAQAWNLVFENKPLFKEKIQAWIHGPAIQEVYREYKEFSYHPIEQDISKIEIGSSVNLPILDQVWIAYGKFDANYLEVLTHNETPWQIAREDSEYDAENEIDLQEMKIYYTKVYDDANT